MRWTTENENILWRTIFQTQNLTLELDKVSQAWPGNDKPTPKAIKEKLNKYRRSGNSKVTFSMGPKNTTATTPARATVTPTPAPRKPHTSEKAAAAVIQGSFGPTGSFTIASTPVVAAGTGVVVSTGRGRGRPRKTATPALADTNMLKNELAPEHPEPVLKRIRTEESSLGTTIEVQIPVSPDPVHFRSDSDKENVGPDLGLRLKSTSTSVQKVKAHTATAQEKEKKRSVPRRSARKSKVENTEAYARCGKVVDCKGTCCGEPRCVYCFGEWEDSSQTLFS